MELIAPNQGRVDKLLADALPQYSRAAIHKLFDMDLIKLNGEVVKPGHKVREGAVIDADTSPLSQEQQVEVLPILYEDDNVIVIDKPAGIISHARGRYWYEPSVASFIRAYTLDMLPDHKPKPEKVIPGEIGKVIAYERAGIVHRLDRATSGVMVCAKNDATMKFLQKQFADRKVEKRYIAVLEGIPENDEAIIDAPIERNPKKPSTFRVGPNGKLAQTQYKILKKGDKRCLVEFMPHTGRTHQLRIHAEYIKTPIVGDTLYGKEADRLYLHAHTITLAIPVKGTVTFTSTVPESFNEAL